MTLKTSDFDYHLPPELIAEHPVTPRDSARMLVVGDLLSDKVFSDLPSFLKAGDVLVMNNTKVIPARLTGKRGDAKVEITLNRNIGGDEWEVFAKPAKRLKVGDVITFAADFCATVTAKNEMVVSLKFDGDLFSKLQKYGHMPLPPYIRKGQDEAGDKQDYQTVFATREGAVAAPTAGLHFTDKVLAEIKAKGVQICFVTLHVGGGTFLPVKSENINEHKMHPEWFELTEEAASTINKAKANGGRVVAVGTTAVRVLESNADENGNLKAGVGETSIFIYPGYKFKVVDVLLTNFHLPKSTLLMLVSAFAGTERIKAAYNHAIAQKYRFYSYGDCCLFTKS